MILRDADVRRKSFTRERCHEVGPHLIKIGAGTQHMPNPIDSHECAALYQFANRRHPRSTLLMANQNATQISAAALKNILLHIATALVGVGDYCYARLTLSQRSPGKHPLLGFSDPVTRRSLNDPRSDTRICNTLSQFSDI
jgi:hypothetical protein